MSEYKRLISYLYAYDSGVKTCNAGFAKVELRNGIVKVSAYIKRVMFVNDHVTFYFYYKRGKRLLGIPIGQILLKNGNGEISTRFFEDVLKDFRIEFDELSGIYISEEDNKDYVLASQWDDAGIDVYQFSLENEEPDKNQENEADYKKYKNSENTENGETFENIEAGVEIVNPEKAEEPEFVAAVVDEPRLFEDDEIYDIKKISADELESMDEKISTYRTNSFLLHGYYSYDHILIGKKYSSNTESEQYVVGVKGVYSDKEKFMASMFGFPYFKKTSSDTSENEKYGYWYATVSF